MSYVWNYHTLSEEEQAVAEKLQLAEQLLPEVAEVLVKRGIKNEAELEHFLRPTLEDLHDPFLMKDMKLAVRRLNKAIGNKEKILVYGDYDVDGITAVTLIYKYLRLITTSIDYYIPDRYKEGSGISRRAIEYAKTEGFTLIIALDCGIKENDMVAYAASLGIDFIICDHHMPDKDLPEAVANLNPKLKECCYPFKELSGAGVGFKLLQGFCISNGSETRTLYNLLDLVAVSIAADLVPLTGENRVLAYFGLKRLNKRPMLGLRSIINVSGLRNKQIGMSDIIFKIGPRINASGRIESGRESVDLLLSRNAKDARAMSYHIDEYNNQRRVIDRSITQEANEIVEGFTDMKDRKIIIVYDPSWHNGVIGIVASRLSEQYNRPTIVLTDNADNQVNGSARSVEGYDIHNLLEQCQELLLNFGGHPYAAGMTLERHNLHSFIQKASDIANRELTLESLQPKMSIDAHLELAQISTTLRRQLRKLAPYGPANEKPKFFTSGVICVTPPRLMGYNKTHLRLMIAMPNETPIYQAVAYGQADLLHELSQGKPFDILYTIDEYAGNSPKAKDEVQLNIQDIHISDNA